MAFHNKACQHVGRHTVDTQSTEHSNTGLAYFFTRFVSYLWNDPERNTREDHDANNVRELQDALHEECCRTTLHLIRVLV